MSTFETPATGARCPHFEQVDDTELQRLFSKVAAIRSQNYELFEFTHRPMEVFQTNASGNPTWHEDRVYQELTRDRLGNFAVTIEGEVGTGKSELSAYLSHRLRLDGRPILHIDKNDDLMSILSERIPEFYEEHFGEELAGAGEFRNLRDDMESVPGTVASFATSGAILKLRRAGFEDVSPTDDEETAIREFVAEKLDTFVNRGGQYDKRIEFVSENEYKQRDELKVFDDSVSSEEAVEALNKHLWAGVRDQYGTDSLDEVLERVASEFGDERPVIVFEDFSIAAMEAEKLRNYVERDVGEDNWDFIIAGTRDATDVLHTRTWEDRFPIFQTNDPSSNSVLFLDKSTAVDFVRPYLGYIKAHDGSVRYDRDTDQGTFDLLEPEPGSICANCGFCDEAFRDLFPFNQPFLRRIYAGLDESQQSPRELIITVFDVLQQFHDGFVDAPSSADTLRPLLNSISVADEVYDEAEVYADLAKWYGTEDADAAEVVVPRQFVDAFGLPTEGLPDAISVGRHEVRIDATGDTPPLPPTDECPDCGSTDRQTRNDGAVICADCGEVLRPPRGPDPIEKKIDDAKAEVDAWFEDPSKYTQTDVYIRRALRDLLDELTDGYRLYEGQPLTYNLSSQKEPFVYTDEGAPDDDQFILDRTEFNRSDLRSLVEFGVYREEQPRSADYDAQLERIGSQLTGYALKWRQRIAASNLDADDVLYKRHAQYDFTDFVLSSYAALCMLDDPWQPVTAERLNERYQGDDNLSIDDDLATALRDVISMDDYAHLDEAMTDADYVESLVGELLGVSANNLDVPRLRQRLDPQPPYQVLSMLGRGQIANIDSRLQFDTGRNVKSFADTMYDVRKALDDVADHGFDRDVVDYVSTVIAGTDLQTVEDLYDRMQTYEQVDPDLLEALGTVCDHDQREVDSVTAAAELADSQDVAGSWERIHAALTSQKLAKTDLVEEFQAVPLQGGGAADDGLGATFNEVSTHYVD